MAFISIQLDVWVFAYKMTVNECRFITFIIFFSISVLIILQEAI